ncbi:MAG: hypothetical protein HUU54_17650, partial [Ignavibacteriaceae bacterium]|nr:hypothetical protein [Ignavibacteriaceae bacterium]
GPSYALETRYRGAYDAAGNPDTVQYEVRYDMRLRYPYQAGQPDSLVARIYVYATYADHNYNPAQIKDTILSSRDLRRSDFNVSTAKLLQFGLAGFRESLGRPDTTIKYVLQTVEFRVKKLSDSLEFLIKEIECYDTRIWKKYFSNLNYYGSEWRTSHIATYLSTFTGNSVFADKFKYVMTIDEPHTIASYDAIRIISEDLDSMRNSNPKTPRLHTHFYPGWNGLRERNKFYTLKNWLLNANPEPLVFYYIHQMSDSPPVAIDVVRNLVHQASKFNDNKPYYFVINTWNEPSSGWRHPRKWELRADVMLALATGCKGIFYEPFYSYSTVEGLTDKKSIPLVFNEIGIFVRDSINARLDTTLGYTLLDYKYTGKYAQTYHQPDTSIVFEGSFIDSDSTENIKILNAEEGITKVFVGLFEHKMNQYDQGIFIVNYDSVSRQVFPRIDKPQAFQHYTNIRVRDCEGGYDTVFSHRLLMRDKLSGGNGKFYLLRPVIRNGGDLVYSDTVKTADTLRENRLRVKAGAILTINASYTASQDIIVESGGKLVINPGKTLTFTDGAKLRVYGSFVSRGMSNSPIGINFTAVDIAKQNGIYLDSLSIDSLEYTNIANCYFGIHSRYTDPYISECNISNTKVGIYLDNAEYQPDMEEG